MQIVSVDSDLLEEWESYEDQPSYFHLSRPPWCSYFAIWNERGCWKVNGGGMDRESVCLSAQSVKLHLLNSSRQHCSRHLLSFVPKVQWNKENERIEHRAYHQHGVSSVILMIPHGFAIVELLHYIDVGIRNVHVVWWLGLR